MNRWFWTFLIVGVAGSLSVLWLTSWPLGIPGEWTWDRIPAEPDFVWNLIGSVVAAGLYVAFVETGRRRFRRAATVGLSRVESVAWLSSLVVVSLAWLWIVQETAPVKNRLGKAAFVLYYKGSSGYFTKARYDAPDAAEFLRRYEDLMRERDVLHVGTHPPGLFLIFHGLIDVCRRPSVLSSFLDVTQPSSFVEACDVIANLASRSDKPRAFLPQDRRVLWLATLLVMISASLTTLPLFALVRRSSGAETAWWTASLWPAVPAVAVFVPKSDVVYAFVGLMIVWAWLTSLDRRSLAMGLLAGLLAWCGLMLSLAFLPVLLFTALVSLIGVRSSANSSREQEALSARSECEAKNRDPETVSSCHRLSLTVPRVHCLLAAFAGFAIPVVLLGWFGRINLLTVWMLNYQNHAGFYEHYPRTYWKWLLVNPLEFSFAAGWPVVLLAASHVWLAVRSCRTKLTSVALATAFVCGSLWLTGKNSGEAARLWIIFLPWPVWLAGTRLATIPAASEWKRVHPVSVVLILQLATALLTVTRVSGFHFE